MASRLSLQSKLVELLGTNNVYFQPPESIKLQYPCIIYKLNDIDKRYANNKAYLFDKSYTLTYIDKNPDNVMTDKILKLPYCDFERTFQSDNLNHYVFRLYY